jgi:hypothetical protein
MATINSIVRRLFLAGFLFIASFFFVVKELSAQENQKSRVSLSEQEWKAVVGIFRSPQNSDMNVQFTKGENILIAKLLWNNKELRLLPESPLVFSSSQEGNQEAVRITFIKDSSGAINKVEVANNGVWQRNNNYKPLVRKEIELTPDQLKQFEGLYQLQGDETRFIQVSTQRGQLVLKQEWDGEQRFFVPESDMDFFMKEVPSFTLNFSKDKEGHINQVVAFKRDIWIKTEKPTISVNQLKSYEGKFRSDDDPDNVVQLIVANGHLVLKQLWDKKEIVLQPKTNSYFYNDTESYPVVILKNKDGDTIKITILGTSVFTKIN